MVLTLIQIKATQPGACVVATLLLSKSMGWDVVLLHRV